MKDIKKEYVSGAYHQLRNVYYSLTNLETSIDDPSNFNSHLSFLLQESVKLDHDLKVLSSLYSKKYVASSDFELLGRKISHIFHSNEYPSNQMLQDIVHYKDIILDLIQNLSLNQQLQYDEFGFLKNHANESLNIEMFFRYINLALEQIFKDR